MKDKGKLCSQIRGSHGETLARNYLEKLGFEVRAQNWRWGHLELDFVATRENVLHIIEVKTRYSRAGGYPEEQVTQKKMMNIIRAAEAFQRAYRICNTLQFDILSIVIQGNTKEFTLIEDVYL
jgi:putative endonuclease